MRNILINLSIICALLFSVGCGKSGVIPTNGSSANAQLIVGKYTETVVEGSANGTNWISYLSPGVGIVITINADKTYSSGTLTAATGAVTDIQTGTWSMAGDGSSITFTATGTSQTQFTIASLTPTSMVVNFQGFNVHRPYSSSFYNYNRITFSRQ